MKISIEQRKTIPYYRNLYNRLSCIISHIRDRCTNVNCSEYHNYGGRGVIFDPKWSTTEGFLDDVDHIDGWDEEKFINHEIQLDKDIKYKGNKLYSKDTCKWVSHGENMRTLPSVQRSFGAYNLYTRELVKLNCVKDFSEMYNLNLSVCYAVLKGRKHKSGDWIMWYLDDKCPEVTYFCASNGKVTYKDINKSRLSKKINVIKSTVVRGFKKKNPGYKEWNFFVETIDLNTLKV